ncbi:hypothetical protein [Streptomyces californicus]|uniref:hypothetical protein n=1 Tax=Streptomyces californicus TaxID=67351 RepID=UPI001E5E4844|nr:hypothetical protein [Streptomyces californicus]MCC0574196.1 hypothetical protein [Streptomyces californicus]
MAGGAYEELSHTGQLGPETFELLRRLVHQVRQSSGFPPPEGYAEWNDDAAYDVITAMLTREGTGQHFVTNCFALAADDASLERLFLTSIKNFLIDEVKKTPRGKLRRRIARLMGTDASFRRIPGPPPPWALSEHPEGAVWQGNLDDLVAGAWRVRGVGITRWNQSGPIPAQTVRALMAIVTQVLRHARGAVREEDLSKVLESRFELLTPARFTPSTPTTGRSPLRLRRARRRRPTPRALAAADRQRASAAALPGWRRPTRGAVAGDRTGAGRGRSGRSEGETPACPLRGQRPGSGHGSAAAALRGSAP